MGCCWKKKNIFL